MLGFTNVPVFLCHPVYSRSKRVTDNFTPPPKKKELKITYTWTTQLKPLTQYRTYSLVYCGAVYTLILHCNSSLLIQLRGWAGGMRGGSQSYLRLFVSYSMRLCSILRGEFNFYSLSTLPSPTSLNIRAS